MRRKFYSVIIGTGKYIPERIIENEGLITRNFNDSFGEALHKTSGEIVEKFVQITDIKARRHVPDNLLPQIMLFWPGRKLSNPPK